MLVTGNDDGDDNILFQYLRNVLYKYMLGTETKVMPVYSDYVICTTYCNDAVSFYDDHVVIIGDYDNGCRTTY